MQKDRADTYRVYDLLNSSGLRCVLKSYVNWYVVSILYYQPQGMTSTMIYENYRKCPVEPSMARELRESRSCVIVHLNELEAEGVVQKGLFKQYVLTEKGKRIYENISKLNREVKAEMKTQVKPAIVPAIPAPAQPIKLQEKEPEKEIKIKSKEIEIKEIQEIKKARIGRKRT